MTAAMLVVLGRLLRSSPFAIGGPPFAVAQTASVGSSDESLRPAVEAGPTIKPTCVERDGNAAAFELVWHHPPVRLAYDRSLRPAVGPEIPVGLFTADAMPGDMDLVTPGQDVSALGSATRVDVVLRPDADAVHDVPVVRPTAAADRKK